jgi:hypothetical protein
MAKNSDPRLHEALPHIERELTALKNALGLLGLKQCSWCRKYLRLVEPGALFDAGQQLVCYGCTYDWWTNMCPGLPVKDRSALEHKLMRWLIYQHHAKVIKQAGMGSGNAPEGIRLTADCIECAGAGRDSAGNRCSHCNGLGIIWVLLTEKLR